MSTKDLALLPLVSFLAGCISISSYPTDWPQIAQGSADACPQVSGSYRNVGERRGAPGRSYLAYQFFPKSASSTRADRVVIEMPDPNTVSIRTMSGVGVLNESTLTREKKEFLCEEGFLAIRKGWSGMSEALGVSNETIYLARSQDGSLMVKETSAGIAIAIIIPIPGLVTTWSRYDTAPNF